MARLHLPGPNGIEEFVTSHPADFAAPDVALNRIAFAAAHVVADPLADVRNNFV